MTLLAGRMPCLHPHYGEEAHYSSKETQGILKSGSAWRPKELEDESYYIRRQENQQRHDEGKRLVRFSEIEERQPRTERNSAKVESQDVIKFGNNTYVINSSDPNSAVSKLFPNSNLTPINPFVSRGSSRDRNVYGSQNNSTVENSRNLYNRTKPINGVGSKTHTLKKVDGPIVKRNMRKVPPETKPKPGKGHDSSTPLIDRIKQLTCDNGEPAPGSTLPGFQTTNGRGIESLGNNRLSKNHEKQICSSQSKMIHPSTDLPKQAKEGLNLMRYNQNISHTRPHPPPGTNSVSPQKLSPTDEARRSFLYSLSKQTDSKPGERESIASNSTTADSVYSLSDIEEALTEEEKEIKDAFSQENKQDELELFVQQDAGRTERLRKRYNSTPKPENEANKSRNFTSSTSNLNSQYFMFAIPGIKKEKPKFGSTIEILQQLQQQIETPYQLEGRRTACSNYSDSSIPISDRLFDESSDGYEPVNTKLNVHRTCSLDSKNYEEIDNFPSAFSVPRAKSHEHPHLTHLESDTYIYPHSVPRHPGNFVGNSQTFEQTIYASSPDLHGYRYAMFPDRVSSYNSHPVNGKQLHPVLQKQYCRYPMNNTFPNPAEEGKVLTPPSRMHTYMNVPPNAPCYISPPPYSKTNLYSRPLVQNNMNNYELSCANSSIYQNVPASINPNLMTLRRLCTEKERGVPEGASSNQDSKEMFPPPSKEYYSSPNLVPTYQLPCTPLNYCVDV